MPSRSRRNSLVQDIATHASSTSFSLPKLLDDPSVFQQLQRLEPIAKSEAQLLPYPRLERKQSTKYIKYHEYLDELANKTSSYEVVIQQVSIAEESLNSLMDNFNNVSLKTCDFKESTHQLAVKFNDLTKLYDTITEYLRYFENLDPIVRKLNHSPSASTVRKDSFKSMLLKIDQSLSFIEQHPDFKDSESYRIRFKQCLIRSCSLMANYLSQFLKHLYADIAEKLSANSQPNVSSSAQEALLYNKFASNVSEFYAVSQEIVFRAVSKFNQRYRDELLAILHDCYNEYFQTRMKLLHPVIWQQLDQSIINEKNVSLTKFIQNNLLYFTQLCTDEYNLLTQFFPEKEGRAEFNEWLYRLCEPLHDCVRGRVLRESEIPYLCDAVTLLNKYYQFEEDSQEYEIQFKHIQFDKIFEPILQDIQSKLVFRAQIYVETNIVGFKPSKNAFMISHRKITSSAQVHYDEIVEDFISNSTSSNEEVKQINSYYPPLVRAIALLSKIYQMVNSSVFDDLAHHIVHDCIVSLKTAYNMVESSERGLDTKLSYLKNLLLLRSQIQNFDIQYISNETYLDFSGLGEFFRSLTDRKFSMPNGSVLNLARESVPKVVNDMVDARYELMAELRNIIKAYTEAASLEVISDCFTTTGDVLAGNIKLRENVETVLPRIHDQMLDFIDDTEIINNLIDAIQDLVVQSYAEYYEKISETTENTSEGQHITSELMCVDVLSDLFNNAAGKLEKEQTPV